MTKIVIVATCLLFASCVLSQRINGLVELDEDNWRLMLEGEWMVEFFAPWCPACKTLAPTWESYAQQLQKVRVGRVDVTKSPALSGRFFVTALPTIFHVSNGEFRQYRGPRDLESLIRFVVDGKWKSIEPVSSWKNPASLQMSLLSQFFKLSHLLKDINTRLHDDYGLPTWGSYALFAIATIFLGAILGLMLVCVFDFLYPPKTHRQSFAEVKQKELTEGSGAIEDIADDELEDEAGNAAKEEEEGDSTSEGERNSGSDNDDENNEKEESEKSDDNEDNNDKESSPQVRKRKTRKAD